MLATTKSALLAGFVNYIMSALVKTSEKNVTFPVQNTSGVKPQIRMFNAILHMQNGW